MDDEPKPIPASDIPTIRSEHFRTLYVNHARGGLTTWDLRFTFSSLVEQPQNNPAVEEQVMLVMTPDFAKALLGTLTTTIGVYETRPAADATPIAIGETSAPKPKKKK